MSNRTLAILILLMLSTCKLEKKNITPRKLAAGDPDDDIVKSFKPLVTNKEKELYEELLDMKLAFQKSIDFLPDAFEPDKDE